MFVTTKMILDDAESFVRALFKDKLPEGMTYHNFEHTRETVNACRDMASYYKLNKDETERLLLAAWFHDTGYITGYASHEDNSIRLAREYLTRKGMSEVYIQEIVKLIDATRPNQNPEGLLEEILHDADYLNIGKKRFFTRAELLRAEWERFLNVRYDDASWRKKQMEFITNNNFYTQYAIEKYGERREKNIVKQTKEKPEKLGRGVETMYRSVYRNHINLSSIADNKANMMISINTIIVSIIIAAIGSGFTFTGFDSVQYLRFTVPIGTLLVGSLISVVFAILSATPKVTSKHVNKEKIEEQKTSVLFFGNFVHMELDKFIESMQLLRKDQDVVYDNMSVDIHYLGHVLQRKYRLLKISYFTFLGSLCLCVVSFIAIVVYSL